MYYIGFDIGSSSIKASLVHKDKGSVLAIVQEPKNEMAMISDRPGWAEQDPEIWWEYLCKASKRILHENTVNPDDIHGIGISYQMHGLVAIDKKGKSLRPSIIWCDGRAVSIGEKAYSEIGPQWCTDHLLNSPGNFTASKLKWVAEHEPEIYERIHKFMLPGDYIAYKLTGEIATTKPGLSEGMLWDFKTDSIANTLLDHYKIDADLVPVVVSTFSEQGRVHQNAALQSGLAKGTPVLYRAGDQPNNALTLNVFQPGEIAATAGTSGVFYAITDSLKAYQNSGVNNFVHVNHSENNKRIGKLLCINGAGIQYRWLQQTLDVNSYEEMNALADGIAVGSDGLLVFPFGNGPERVFGNSLLGASVKGLEFNTHSKGHLCRAALEGIAFAMSYGMELLQEEGIRPDVIRAGSDNMFRSKIFSQTIANLIQRNIDIYNNTGATGAARACNLVHGNFSSYAEQVERLDFSNSYNPDNDVHKHRKAYDIWKEQLEKTINKR